MRKVSYFVACSLDGYITGKDGDISWLFTDGDYGYADFYAETDTLLMGRTTFDVSMTFGECPYLGKEVLVFSRTKSGTPHPGIRYLNDDPAASTRRLKSEPGNTIWLVGGSQLAAPLLQEKLVDELVLSIHPVTLGDGIPLFPNGMPKTDWKVIASKIFDSDLVQLTYQLKL